jgi:hypothetical protein
VSAGLMRLEPWARCRPQALKLALLLSIQQQGSRSRLPGSSRAAQGRALSPWQVSPGEATTCRLASMREPLACEALALTRRVDSDGIF